MKTLIIGSGIAGLTASIESAKNGNHVILVSPYPSERAQSVMAAGGINAVGLKEDSISCHVEDTLKAGRNIGGREVVEGLCEDAPQILNWLESVGVVFTRNADGSISRRAFGGQTYNRTAFAGTSTGKQIVSALCQELRKYECLGLVERKYLTFRSALVENGECYGACFDGETIYADATIFATGGQNALFGKTTGSTLCDGYATGRLFLQGVALKNLEIIQYHPTAIETSGKKMLISEAARGEGGRLYYLENGKRVYFMEEKFGEKGNLMPRDVVSKCIYDMGRQVYLDVSFLGKKVILSRLLEIYDLCKDYLGIDITKESIPVTPTVHFFMGGIAVDKKHRTSVKRMYAIGECASIYHGANRLGGNSLLAAIHGARVAVSDTLNLSETAQSTYAEGKEEVLDPAIPQILNGAMGICRDGESLQKAIEEVEKLEVTSYSALAKAILVSANARKESRGAFIRTDYPEMDESFEASSIIRYDSGKYTVSYVKEDEVCW